MKRRTLWWLLLAAPSSAMASPDTCGALDLGLGWLDDPAFRHGRFAGESGRGSFGVLRLDACGRADRSDEARYWMLRLEDADLDARRAVLRFGIAGRYRIELEHRGLSGPRDPASTPLRDVGGNALRLPADWIATPTTAGMTRLLPSLGEIELGSTRRLNAIGLAAVLPAPWSIETRVHSEARSGLKSFAGLIGNSGGNPRVIMLPEPIDSRTHAFDATLLYAVPERQFRIGYHLSLFDNAYASLQWQNPFAAIAGWDPAAGHPLGLGQAQPAPDNQFHRLAFAYAQPLSSRMRLNADLALGRMLQDQAFLPYSVNPALQDSILEPLPRTSLDGRIDTTLFNLRLVSRAASGWHWTAAYRLDDRDNRTPQAEYLGIGGDSQRQDASPASVRRRTNLPYGYREQRLGVDAGTRAGKRTRIDLGAAQSRTDRSWSARERTDETRMHLAIRSEPHEWLNLAARVSGSERGGSTYLGNRSFLATYAPAYTATVPGGFENLPGLRSFPLADRRRLQSGLALGLTPGPRWNLGLGGGTTQDDYRRSELGLTEARIRDLNFDANFVAAEGWTLHAFASREWMAFAQDGRSFQGGANRLPQAADPARNWNAQHRDRVDTRGLGMRRDVGDGRLSLGLDVARARVRSEVQVTTGAALSALPLPATRARLTTLDLDARWRVGGRTELLAAWRLESFRSSDWARDGVAPNTLANVILLGEQSPAYRSQAVSLALRYRF
jgi:MtrB/PioB family decaheme-associated outer membrane protein